MGWERAELDTRWIHVSYRAMRGQRVRISWSSSVDPYFGGIDALAEIIGKGAPTEADTGRAYRPSAEPVVASCVNELAAN
jgi:hypothetical protein